MAGSANLTKALESAFDYYSRGNLTEAENAFRSILSQETGEPDALHLLGIIRFRLGDYNEAVYYLGQAISITKNNPALHFHLGLVLEAMDKYDEAIKSYKEAIVFDPDYVEAYNNLGNVFYKMGMWDTALKLFAMALKLNSHFFEACINMGNTFKQKGALRKAVIWQKKALSIEPRLATPYNNLGNIKLLEGKLEDAAEFYEKALQLQPEYPDAMNNYGSLLRKWGRYEEALDYYSRALKLAPDFAGAHLNYASVLLVLKRFSMGWQEYEWRLDVKAGDEKVWNLLKLLKKPRWDGAPIKNKSLLVYTEQGMGDSIQFIRFIPSLLECAEKVIFACQPALLRLFSTFTFPGLTIIGFPGDGVIKESYDYHIPLLSLPGIMEINENNIPGGASYLEVAAAGVEKWKHKLSLEKPAFRIGLVWAGNPNHPDDRNRSCALSLFEVLANIGRVDGRDVEFYSLQKGDAASQVNDLSEEMRRRFNDLGMELTDFEDTAAVIMNLDLVITVDTSVAHLVGALGKPVWMLVPFDPDWRWMLDSNESPWYPSMRLFRQNKPREWVPVFREIAEELQRSEMTTDKHG
ncbi:MAG: tetratricopeptide repeat protein, partial [bacterium]|nr:tetratricopeptide repeat protein [bacterium]